MDLWSGELGLFRLLVLELVGRELLITQNEWNCEGGILCDV